MKKQSSIAFIGAGASTILVLHQLKKLEIKNVQITIFEKTKPRSQHRFGPAYSVPPGQVLLNTDPKIMGIDSPEEYELFCQKHNLLPTCRHNFGLYLQNKFEKIVAQLEENHNSIHFIHEKVVFLDKTADQKNKIMSHTQKEYLFDQVVLAQGAPFRKIKRPDHFSGVWVEHLNQVFDRMADLCVAQKIAILGASQSAIDASMILFKNGFEGEIHFFPPSGHPILYKQEKPKNSELEKKWQLLLEENHSLSLRKIIYFVLKNYPKIRQDPQAQFLQDSTHFLSPLWGKMDGFAQNEFVQKYQTWLRKERSALSRENTKIWQNYQDRTCIDRLKNFNPHDFEAIINASGLDPDAGLDFLSEKLSAPHPWGGNYACAENHYLINPQNQKEKKIFIVGYPGLGAYGFVNAFYFLKPKAEKIAQQLFHFQSTLFPNQKLIVS